MSVNNSKTLGHSESSDGSSRQQQQINTGTMSIQQRIQQLGLNKDGVPSNAPPTSTPQQNKLPQPPQKYGTRKSGPQEQTNTTTNTNGFSQKNLRPTTPINTGSSNGLKKTEPVVEKKPPTIAPRNEQPFVEKKTPPPIAPRNEPVVDKKPSPPTITPRNEVDKKPVVSKTTGPPPLPSTASRTSIAKEGTTDKVSPHTTPRVSTPTGANNISQLQRHLVDAPEVSTPYDSSVKTPVDNVEPLTDLLANANSRKTLPPPPSKFTNKGGATNASTGTLKSAPPPPSRTKSQIPKEGTETPSEPVAEAPKKGVFVEYKPPAEVAPKTENVAKIISEEEMEQKQEFNERYKSLTKQEIQAAITIQKNYRGFKARKVVKKKKNNLYTRRRNMLEILSTEETYVKCLSGLLEVYLKPLKKMATEPNPCISARDVSIIFSDIEVITNVAEAFYEKLKERIDNPAFSDQTKISDVFMNMAPYFKTYSRYCNNYDKSITQLKKNRENETFKNLIAGMDRDSRTTKLGLPSYLILPIQRIPRYQLLLRDLINHTDPSHPDYADLQSAEEKIRQVAVHLNSAMKIIDATNELLRVQQSFLTDFNFIEPYRRFKKEGPLDEFLNQDLGQRQSVYVHLFNDMIVLSKPRGDKFEIKSKVMLAGATLLDYIVGGEENENEKFVFQVKAPQQTLYFKAASETEKAAWMEAIDSILIEAKKANQSSSQIIVNQVTTDDTSTTLNIAINSESQNFELSPEECVQKLKEGATMLKYCRNARPHFRKIILSQDEEFLMWGSPNKSSHESVVSLKEVKKIVTGQKTAMFQRYRNPDLENLSFSLLYKNRTLDLCCKDKREYDTWVQGISHLLYELENDTGSRASRRETALNLDPLALTPSAPAQTINLVEEQKKFKEQFERIGDAYAWGQGSRGALGHGDQNDQTEPLVVKDFLFLDVSSVECENSAAAAVMLGGELFTWGAGDNGRLGHGDEGDRVKATLCKPLQGQKIVSCKMGLSHTLALADNGHVWAFGGNLNGQTGLGPEEPKHLKPTVIPSLKGVKEIECGHWHSACTTSDGKMWTWGSGEDGQLGHGSKTKVCAVPTQVKGGLSTKMVTQCSLGLWHTLAVCQDGTLWSWGNSTYGQLGHGNTDECLEPTEISFFSKNNIVVVQAAAGSTHSGCITKTGEIYMWGNGIYGQIGNGKKQHAYTPTRVDALAGRQASRLACGVNHVMVLLADNNVYSWGAGTYGRLGVKNESDQHVPVHITFLADKSVRNISCGGSQSVCVCAHQWVPDKDAHNCMDCKAPFTFIRRRHHCRYCGGIFCGSCTHRRITLLRFGHSDPVRVCNSCYTILSKR